MTAKADNLYNAIAVAAVTGASARLQGQRYAHSFYSHSPGDVIPAGHGDSRFVSVETIYRIAITEETVKAKVPIRIAVKGAALFSESQANRRANTLFEFGRTLIVVKEGRPAIVNASFDALLTEVCGNDGAFVIDLGPIVKAVTEKLSQLKRKK